MVNEQLRRAWSDFVQTHIGDLQFVHEPKIQVDVTESLFPDSYNLALPSLRGLEAMLEADFLVWACMDRRQVIQVANQLGIDRKKNIMVTTAGGPEQRGNRLAAGVNFWSELFTATGGRINAAFVVHNEICGGARVQEGEDVIKTWREQGIEDEMMRARAHFTRKAVFSRSPRKQVIDVGLASIDARTGYFEYIDW